MASIYPSGEEKHRLQELLKDIDFGASQEELEKFKCDFCKKIALERHLVSCEHGFCNACYDEYVHGRACPVKSCDNKLIQTSTRKSDFEDAVYRLEVFCRNKRLGCKMKVPLIKYLEHEGKCPVAVDMAQASDKVIKSMRAEIDDLKHVIKSLQSNLTRAEENVKMNLYEERALKTDLQLMEGKLNDIISQKMTMENQKISAKFDKEFQRIAKEQSTLQALVDKNFAIQQNQELGLEKKEMERYIKDQISQECATGMRDFSKDVTEMVNDFAKKQKEELKATISDELIGRLSMKQFDLEIQMQNVFDEKLKSMAQNMENKIVTQFDNEKAATKATFEKWSVETLNIKMKALKKDFEEHFILFLNRKCEVYKRELSDVMLEDVNDKLDECTQDLITHIKNELEVKIGLQKQFLLTKLLQEIQIKSEKYKIEVQSHVEKKMLAEFTTQKKDFHTYFLEHINKKMHETEIEFCTRFSNQINEKMDEQSQELHSTLKNEFNNEIMLIQGHIQEQYEEGLQLESTIEDLDANYLGKTNFLLEKYSTTFVWPIPDFLMKAQQLESGAITEVESDNFMVKACKMLMKAKLTWRNNSILLKLGFLTSEHGQAIYHHRRTVWLLDQRVAVEDRKHRVRVEEPKFGSKMAQEWMDGFCALGINLFPSPKELSRSHFLKDGTVIVQIAIEPLAILYKSMASNNGILVWKIENVSKLIQDEKSRVIDQVCSPYFYSSPNGYRLQLAMYFAKPFLSLYLNFLSGQFDAFLSITFTHRTTFMILDQSDSTEKKHVINRLKIGGDTYADFVTNFARRADILGNSVPHSIIDPLQPVYLKDDALLIKVIIEPLEDCKLEAD